MTESSQTSHSPWPLTLVLLAAIAASTWFVSARVAATEDRARVLAEELAQLRRSTELIRLEGKSQGRGIGAIIEQIEFWAPQLATAATPHPAAVNIEKALGEALFAVEALGRDAYPTLAARLETAPQLDDETRRWLMRAALRADRRQALELAAAFARGTRGQPSPNFRLSAARELVAADKTLAGTVLRQIVDIESARGVTRQPPPELAPEYERVIGVNSGGQFYNFIPLFVATGHPETALVLRQLLGRHEHDLLTYQECVRELGTLRCAEATSQIRELFDHPPGNTFNPMFQNTCLTAIVEIEGPLACDWFKAKLQTEKTEMVAARLQELIKQLCGT
ncbi:MAG: hypothetical protein IT457_03510 [Planctomycetes bacterium]|nr:hypothetical protein [Planctomycetota bacterium]